MSRALRWMAALAGLFGLAGAALAEPPTDQEVREIRALYRQINSQVSLPRMDRTYRDVSAFGSRIAGSEGERRTLAYVESAFRRLGLKDVRREPFTVAVPDPSATATLRFGGRTATLYPLWPNLVRASTADVSGPLLYGGDGSLESFRGKQVRGSIVILEFDSGSRWRNAAKLGAKAIVFLQSPTIMRGDAEDKFSSVPVDVPRFYLRLDDAAYAMGAAMRGESASLKCRQDWVNLESSIVSADLPGDDPKAADEQIVLMAYADSMSVVPGLAPGAEAIGGLAALLEMAEVWRQRPHRRPIRFVVAGAHHLGLRGARQFVANQFERKGGPEALMLVLTLDLTSGSTTIGSYGRGWAYEYRDEPMEWLRGISRTFRAHATRLQPVTGAPQERLVLTDAVNNSDNRTWKNNISGKFALDCEPIVSAGYAALTFATIEDSRETTDTPYDTLNQVKTANVWRQAQTTAAMMHHLLNDTSDRNETREFRVPLQPRTPSRMSLVGGFAELEGRVVAFDPEKSFLPDVSIGDSLVAVLGRQKTMMGVRGDIVQLTGKDARYRIDGIPPISSYWQQQGNSTRLAAFRIDPPSGKIDHAVSQGFFGTSNYPTEFQLTSGFRSSPIVVFPCVAVNLFDLVDPMDLRALPRLSVQDAFTGAEPTDFGLFSPPTDMRLAADVEDVQVLFTLPGTRFRLLGGAGAGDRRLILTASTVAYPDGQGYKAPGEARFTGVVAEKIVDLPRASAALSGTFDNVPLNSALDILALNQSRIEKFKKYRIISQGILDLQREAEAEAKAAEESIAARDWPDAERHARASWGFGLRAHPVLQQTGNDVVNGVVFYLFLLIPFSYFVERLFFGSRLMTRQLAITSAVFMLSFVILRLIHPAFEIVTNPAMIFVGFVMGALSLIVIAFILGKFESSLRVVKQQQSGLHEVDIRRTSVALAAFNLGVNNMRRRKARTFLTTLTLVVMTFIVLSFTSIVSEIRLNEFPSENEARYSGMLLRNADLQPMQLSTFRQVLNEFQGRGTVVRRIYYYGADIGDTGVLSLRRADRVVDVRAMLGLEPGEQRVTQPQQALLPGGRWFKPGERDVMLIPVPVAQALKITPDEVGKAKVTYAGVDYTIIGIYDPATMRGVLDLDGDGIFPPDFSLSRRLQQETASSNQAFRSFIRLDPGTAFILPAETALNLGGELRTLAVAFEQPTDTRKALEALMPRLRLNMYASVPSADDPNRLEVKQFSVFQANRSTGIVLILVQLAIAAVFVLNTMVASVYERTKEIAIFSSIGLAPNHIAMLFFAESLVYGVLGAVVGYILAQLSAKFIVSLNILEGLYLNFSSTSAVLSAGLVMAVVLGSTIYPARKASQIAAPAMNEEVFNSEPEGDDWSLELPFSVSAVESAPLIEFLGQWFKAYEEYTIGDFVTSGSRTWSPESGIYQTSTVMWLAPYDLGIQQQLTLTALPTAVPGVYALDLNLKRMAGDPENWPIVNRRFLANLRRQFLTWRTLNEEQRTRYRDQAAASFGLQTETADA